MTDSVFTVALLWGMPVLVVLLLWQSRAMKKGRYERDALQVLALLSALAWPWNRVLGTGVVVQTLVALATIAACVALVVVINRAAKQQITQHLQDGPAHEPDVAINQGARQ